MFVRLSTTGQVVDMPQAQAGAMIAAGDAEVPGNPNAHSNAAETSRALRRTRKPDAARNSIWVMIIGELVQAGGVLAMLAGLALGVRDLRVTIPIACGLIAFYIGRRIRRWGTFVRPAPRPQPLEKEVAWAASEPL